MTAVDRWTGRETRLLRHALRLSVRAFAEDLGVSPRTVSKWESGGTEHQPRPELQAALDTVLRRASDEDRERFAQTLRLARPPHLAATLLTSPEEASTLDLAAAVAQPVATSSSDAISATDDDMDALELSRRVTASDVSSETLAALESVVDDLACDYPRSPPQELLERTRRYLSYVAQLTDAKMTLAQRRRLAVTGAWLSLIAATCEIDLGRSSTASLRLRTAAQLAAEADHQEIVAWVLETRAWHYVTAGDYRRAVSLSQDAQSVAPRGSSAFIQATAQEGRAWARLGDAAETRQALSRVERLVEPLSMPERAEHHFRYDPAKSDAYLATTLSWLGDPAAEPYARDVLARLEAPSHGMARPRRAASARLDLSLALLAANQPDEAVQRTLEAVTSGRLVPSNYWRAGEIVRAVEPLHVAETSVLREAYRELTH